MTMLITAPLDYEGHNFQAEELGRCLKEFHKEHPFATGLDWGQQEFWATMTEELALIFALKYPKYADKFRKI